MNTPTSTSDTTQYQPCIDECCYRLGRALRAGRLEPDSWGFNFTRSILKQSKRRNWMPSERQLSTMQKLSPNWPSRMKTSSTMGVSDDRAA